MVTWQDFLLDSVQATLFTPNPAAFASGRVVSVVLREFGERFNGEMQVLPLPLSVPPEVPRVVLQSGEGSQVVGGGSQVLNAGPLRFDCVWNRGNTDTLPSLHEVVCQCVQVLSTYVRETAAVVGRLALVVQRVCPNETPAQTLIERFCAAEAQREPFNRSATFEIHNHKEYLPVFDGVDYRINSWVRCRCGDVQAAQSPTIVVVQDLNTMAAVSEQQCFSADAIEKYFSMASSEAEAILMKYFPG
jgi:hypothetical protein